MHNDTARKLYSLSRPAFQPTYILLFKPLMIPDQLIFCNIFNTSYLSSHIFIFNEWKRKIQMYLVSLKADYTKWDSATRSCRGIGVWANLDHWRWVLLMYSPPSSVDSLVGHNLLPHETLSERGGRGPPETAVSFANMRNSFLQLWAGSDGTQRIAAGAVILGLVCSGCLRKAFSSRHNACA